MRSRTLGLLQAARSGRPPIEWDGQPRAAGAGGNPGMAPARRAGAAGVHGGAAEEGEVLAGARLGD